MPLIYGSGFKPGTILLGEIKQKQEKKTTEDTALFTFLRVLTAVAFIALSFIPVAGEAGEAALIAGEAGLEAGIEATAEAGVEAAIASSESLDLVAGATRLAQTARTIKLGEITTGSIALGLTEAGVNETLDRLEGTNSIVNSVLNFSLAFIPALGAFRGRRAATLRLAQSVDKQIKEQYELLKLATTVEQRASVEMRIRQLKNAKLVRTSKIFGAPIDSATTAFAKKEVIKFVENEATNGASVTVRKVSNEIRKELNKNAIRLSRNEARLIVRSVSKSIPSITEGITVKGLVQSRYYNKVVQAMQYLDPNLAARKVLGAAQRKLTSNEALWSYTYKGERKEIGKWFKNVNIGYYKKFGKKISKWWRKWGTKVYKASRHRMIPVLSLWIDGYRLIDTGIPGEYIMIVIFKPSTSGRIPPPVIVNPVSLAFVERFSTGGEYNSVGSFYINKIALARNGSGPALSSSLATILGPLSLGTIRGLLSSAAGFERIIRKVSKGDYFTSWIDNVSETTSRLWTHKIGKVVAGRWGIATARGFQRTRHGHTSLSFSNPFDVRHIIDEMGIVTLDKARSVQRKAGIKGRTTIIGGGRIINQFRRTIKLGTFGYAKFDGKKGIKKGNGIF